MTPIKMGELVRSVGLLGSAWQEWEVQGREIARQNPRLAQFGQMLAHPEFADFFERNFSTLDDARHSVMLLQAGLDVQAEIRKQTGELLDGNQLTAILKALIDNRDTRRFMVEHRCVLSDPRGGLVDLHASVRGHGDGGGE